MDNIHVFVIICLKKVLKSKIDTNTVNNINFNVNKDNFNNMNLINNKSNQIL